MAVTQGGGLLVSGCLGMLKLRASFKVTKNDFIFATIYPFKSTSWYFWQVFWSLQPVIMWLWHVLTQGQWSLQKHDWSLKLSHSLILFLYGWLNLNCRCAWLKYCGLYFLWFMKAIVMKWSSTVHMVILLYILSIPCWLDTSSHLLPLKKKVEYDFYPVPNFKTNNKKQNDQLQ